MALIVQKFGGTSVGDLERIQLVAEKVKGFKAQGHNIVVVVSAMSGETNRLIQLAEAVKGANSTREMDVILSTGEQVTIALVSMALNSVDCPAISLTGSQVVITTDSAYTKARIQNINTDIVRRHLDAGRVVVIAGFQGCDSAGNITTLGRGGSDTTAVAMAAALKADECQIYTDVDGVFTTDPRVVEDARLLESITFEEMLEMASLGSKVLQIRAVEFAGKYNVNLRVQNAFQEGAGTMITLDKERKMESAVVSGIAFNRDEAKLTIRGVPHIPGVAVQILGPVSRANIEVDMIVQNVGEDQSTDFTFTVHKKDYQNTMDIISRVAGDLKASGCTGDSKIAKVSLVGVGMRSHAGVATLMFETLAQEGINIEIISTSEIKISVVIAEKYLELAVRALHSAFELDREPFETKDV
ncbi:MAG: aspartate kinase [Candidatus Endonucleobacter sp. (ex Gigantidas childressi)]|nr:aspartate kinase [Candidatus Endonucleobacter sp. (ex Gigantidas childressi)]